MSEDILKRIVAMATMQVAAEELVATAEKNLKESKKEVARISCGILPELMLEAGVFELTLPDGREVSLKEDFFSKIPDDRMQDAFAWLKERHYEGIIKTKLAIEFGRDESAEAQDLAIDLESKGFGVLLNESIHHSTLKSFLKELMDKNIGLQEEDKQHIPFDLFGITPFNQTKIK